jgi:hypothetical protein
VFSLSGTFCDFAGFSRKHFPLVRDPDLGAYGNKQIDTMILNLELAPKAVLRIRIQDPGSGVFLTPGSGIWDE